MKKNLKKTILIVEDDEEDKEFLCETIHSVDCSAKCVWVSNGEHALRLLLSEDFLPPHYIFLDLHMPRLGGKQCLDRIKDVARLAHVPVIVYTSSRFKEGIINESVSNRVHFLTKSSDKALLNQAVTCILNNDWIGLKLIAEKQQESSVLY